MNWRFVGVWVAALVFIPFVVWAVPPLQVQDFNAGLPPEQRIPPSEVSALVNEYRRTLAQVLGGLALLGTLYFTWRRVAAAERTVDIAQESNITERFTQAIGQLGDEKIEVRLGAIYALERIAKDSEKDYWPIMEVLTAYLRNNASWDDGYNGPIRNDKDVPSDTQAVMTVLNRRARRYKFGEEYRLDLRRTDLRGIEFPGIHLEGALLKGSRLDRALLHGARFDEADLTGTSLEHAGLVRASFKAAAMEGADLEGAVLRDADFEGEAVWEGTRWGEEESNQSVFLEDVELRKTSLVGAKLRGVSLASAKNLTWKQLRSAVTDEKTKLPDYLRSRGELAEESTGAP